MMTWTDEMCDDLREHWPYESASVLCGRFGCTRSAVIGKARRMGLMHKHKSGGKYMRNVPRHLIIREVARTTVLKALPWHCRWPIDQSDGTIGFCGLAATKGSYCPTHDWLAHKHV